MAQMQWTPTCGELDAFLLCPADVLVKNKGSTFGGRRKAVCDRARMNGNGPPELHETIEYMNMKQKELSTTMERKQKLGHGRKFGGGT